MNNPLKNPISLDEIKSKEIIPGFTGRFIHTDNMTFAFWTILKDAELPEHAHHHEQVVNLLDGVFELTVGGKPHQLKAGDILIIPGDVPHSGRAISNCRILDVFHPTREDYR